MNKPKISKKERDKALRRKAKGENVATIASEMGINPSSIYYWQAQYREPSARTKNTNEQRIIATEKKKKLVQNLVSAGMVQSIAEIFDYINIIDVYRHVGVSYLRMREMVTHTGGLKIEYLHKLADFFQVDPGKLVDLAHRQYLAEISTKKQKK
jgi:transposase-like protein